MKKESGTENNFLNSLQEDLEKDLNNLALENKKEQEKHKIEIIESVKKILVEEEKKNEEKLKMLYYWLFGISLTLLITISGVFFYLKK